MILLKFPIVYKCHGQRFISRFRSFVICPWECRVYLNVKSLDWELLQGPWVNGLKCRTTLSGRLGSPGSKGTTKNLCIGHLLPLHTSMSSTLLVPQRVPHRLRGPASILLFHHAYSPKNFETLYNSNTHRQKGFQTKTVSKNFLERGDIIAPGTWHASLSHFGGEWECIFVLTALFSDIIDIKLTAYI